MRRVASPSASFARPVPRHGAVAALAISVMLMWARGSAACSVCFGEAEGPGLEGAWAPALLLVGLVYGLIALGFVLWHRARRRVTSPRQGDSPGAAESAVHGR